MHFMDIYRLAIEWAIVMGYPVLAPYSSWRMMARFLQRHDLPALSLEQATVLAEGLPFGAREIYEACQPPPEVLLSDLADQARRLAELINRLP